MIEYIASGAFADVFKVTKKDEPGSIYALKRVRCIGLEPQHQKLIQSEILLHLEYLPKHPNILRAFDVFNYEKYCCFIMDYCKITLEDLIHDKDTPLWLKMRITRQLTSGIDALFQKSFVHRDLKPQNVLISGTEYSNYQVRISGFGLSKRLNPISIKKQLYKQNIPGAPLFMAPQILENKEFDTKADIWALGCLIYLLFIGQSAFHAISWMELMQKIKTGEYMYPKNAKIPFEAICFIDRCIQYQPKNRDYSYNLLQHEFLKTSNMEDLHSSEALKKGELILNCRKDNFKYLMKGQID